MPEKNKKNLFNKEKLYLLGAATILAVLIAAGENAFMFSQDSLFARVTGDSVSSKVSEAKALTAEAGLKDMIFTDIPSNHPNATAIKYLKDKGIMKGYADGSFQPDKAINRAELIKIIIVAIGAPNNLNEHKNCFTDVKEEWYAPFGCFAKWKGWVQGYGDGGFHPSNDVTRSEALKMMLAAYGTALENIPMAGSSFTDLNAQEWYARYVWTAEKLDITSEWKDHTSANLNNKATRLEVATAIYKLEITESGDTPTI